MSKIALITGANKGIGLETARQLGRDHGFTVLIGARDESRGLGAVEELRTEGIDAHFVALDVTDEASIVAAAATVADKFGKLDVLINNAGIFLPEDGGDGLKLPLSALRETYEVNVFGVVRTTQEFWPLLEKSEAARVVNLSSVLGSVTLQRDFESEFGPYKVLAYNSSKAALNMITVHFAYLWKDTPHKINAAHPGYVATDINNNQGVMNVEDGAKTSVELSVLGADGPTGGFYHLGEELPW